MSIEKKILYVEDTYENRILIRRILQAEGFAVIEAENAKQALEVLKEETPDLILMDINMPDMDGYTLTSQMRTIPKLFDIPIVALTANVMRGDRERTLAAGCDGYIQKPIDVDTFPQQIRHYLNR
jgi:two-component system, cell cycle response regulator DivK